MTGDQNPHLPEFNPQSDFFLENQDSHGLIEAKRATQNMLQPTKVQRVFIRERETNLRPSVNVKTRAILSSEQAIEIFKIKLTNQTATRSQPLSPCVVARAYGVSEKAVRDIWNGRTWLRETMHLDPIMAARLRPPRCLHLCVDQGKADGSDPSKPNLDASSSAADLSPASARFKFPSTPQACPHAASFVSTANHAGRRGAWWDAVTALCPAAQQESALQRPSSVVATHRCLRGDRHDSSAESAPLPESSCADDPFHDDWRYWPEQEARRL